MNNDFELVIDYEGTVNPGICNEDEIFIKMYSQEYNCCSGMTMLAGEQFKKKLLQSHKAMSSALKHHIDNGAKDEEI